jgi:nitrate/nitrite-specific signal transduction histidine kinase
VATMLHDGVAQETSLLAGQLRMWAQGRRTLAPRLLAEAAERALDESRSAIAALNGRLDEPLDQALLRMADDVEARVGVPVRTDVQEVPVLPRPARDVLLRAARQAVLDGARAEGAGQVAVTLRGGDTVRLTVVTQGEALESDAEQREPLLAGLRAALQIVGGRLVVDPVRGAKQRLEMHLPCPT